MHKKGLLLLLCGLFVFTYALSAGALPPEVENALHDVNILTLENSSDLSEIWDLRDVPEKYDMVKITKIELNNFSTAQLDTLKNWVRGGGTLWCDPARRKTLEEFGIEVSKWDEGWNVVRTTGNHPVVTAVKELKLYVIGNFTRGTDVPLLLFEGKVVGGISYFGQGTVLAVNSWDIKKDYKDGERFLANLKEFGAGYPVPTSGGTVPGVRYDELKLIDEEILTGEIKPEVLTFRTPYGRFDFYQSEIASIGLDGVATLSLKRGDRLIGELELSELEIRLRSGEWTTIRKDRIKSIRFGE